MAPKAPIASSDGSEEADLAKAFQELAKGERTATALENQLSKMEERIEALLAQAEEEQRKVDQTKNSLQEESKDKTPSGGSDGKAG